MWRASSSEQGHAFVCACPNRALVSEVPLHTPGEKGVAD